MIEVLETRIAPASLVNPTTVTYTDVDGDLVTLKITKGTFDTNLTALTFVASGLGEQLQKIDLTNPIFAGTNVTVTATRGPAGGDGFVNVGFIDAADGTINIDLGTVSIDGDLGRLRAGDATLTTPALKSLTAQSLGALGLSTQGGSGELFVRTAGSIGGVTIKGDIYSGIVATNGSLGAVTVSGSLIGGAETYAGSLYADLNIGNVKVGGAVQGGSGMVSGAITAGGSITSVTIGGSLEGGSNLGAGSILSSLSIGAVKIGTDVRAGTGAEAGRISSVIGIKSVSIGGSLLGNTANFVEYNAQIYGGVTLGAVTISGDVRGGQGINDATIVGGTVTSVTIGGSLVGGQNEGSGGIFSVQKNIGTVTIGGSLEAGTSFDTGRIIAATTIGTVKIGGSWLRLASGDSVIEAQGGGIGSVTVGIDVRTEGGDTAISTTNGGDLGALTVNGSILGGAVSSLVLARGAIKTLTVKGSIVGSAVHDVLFTVEAAGTTPAAFGKVTVGGKVEQASFHGTHADSTFGAFSIGGDWIASTLAAGTDDGADNRPGTGDDTLLGGGNPTKLSTLTSLTIKGMAYGTPGETNNTDRYSIFAEKIGPVNIGGTALPVTAGQDYLLASSTPDVFIGEKTNPVSSYLVINEVLTDYLGSSATDDSKEYVELRGQPGTTIPNGTYLVLIESDGGGNLGDVRHIIDLSGVQLGGAGFLVLAQAGSTYTFDPDTTVLESTGPFFTGLPGYSADVDAPGFVNGSLSYLLVQSVTAPTLADDIDTDNDGIADGTVFSGWQVRDSIGILDASTDGDRSYATITFRDENGSGQATGTVIDVLETADYVGRYHNSRGSGVNDWFAGDNFSYTNGGLNLSILNEEGNFRTANHFGSGNFFELEWPYGPTQKNLTFQDVDGDLVTISSDRFETMFDVKVVPRGLGLQLQSITFTDEYFDQANVTISAKRGPDGGDGFVNVGRILARGLTYGVDLGNLVIDGDLGKITVGDADQSDVSLKSLTVHSLGAFGTTTQPDDSATNLESHVNGGLGTLTVKSDLRGARVFVETGIGGVNVGGSLIGGDGLYSGSIYAFGTTAQNGPVKIGGSLLGGEGQYSGSLSLAGRASTITIGGSLEGGTAHQTGRLAVFVVDHLKIGGDVIGGADSAGKYAGAITINSGVQSLTIGGSVRGGASDYDTAQNLGQISVANFGIVTVGGSIIGGAGDYSGQIRSNSLSTLKVGGSIIGGSGVEAGGVRSDYGSGVVASIGGSIVGGTSSLTGFFSVRDVKTLTVGGSLVMSAGGGGKIYVDKVLGSLVIADNLDARLAPGGAIGVQALEIKNATVNGWILGRLAGISTALSATEGIGALTVKGSLLGASAASPLEIVGLQSSTTPKTVAFGKVTVGGKVQNATFVAGGGLNGDAQIGAISIGGDFIASRIAAGTSKEGDNLFGTGDDNFIGGGSALLSKIASLTVKGMAYGTPGGTDEFRILAQTIGKVTVGNTVIPITPGVGDLRIGPTNDLFARDAS